MKILDDFTKAREPQPANTGGAHAAPYLSIARACRGGAIIIGACGILGWFLGIPVLNSIVPGLQPIVISTSLVFMILGGVQFSLARTSLSRRATVILLGLALMVGVFGLLEMIKLTTGAEVSIEDAILRRDFPSLHTNPNAHISPGTGAFVFLRQLAGRQLARRYF